MTRNRALAARTFALLFALGAALLLITLAIPGDPDREFLPLLVVAGVGLTAALGISVAGGRTPDWLLEVTPALGSVLVTAAVYFGGPGAVAAYAVYYPWIILAAAYVGDPRALIVHVAIAVGGYALVLLVRDDVALGLLGWAMAAGTLAIVAGLGLILRARVDDLIRRLSREAGTDPLTGLANRRELGRRLSAELARSARTGRPVAVIAVDLDGFKRVNDSFGHGAGDQVLQRVAELLRDGTREIDTVSRTGGEEFAVLVPETVPEVAAEVADRLRVSIAGSFVLPGVPLTASCGVAGSADAGPDLLRAADRALYAAKRSGKNRTIAYDPEWYDFDHMAEPGDRRTGGLRVRQEMGGTPGRRSRDGGPEATADVDGSRGEVRPIDARRAAGAEVGAAAARPALDATIAPGLRLESARKQKLGEAVFVKATCDRDCTAEVSGIVKLKGGGARARAVERAALMLRPLTVDLMAGQTATLRPKLRSEGRKAVKRLLGRGGKARVQITVLVIDEAGNSSSASRVVRLR